MRRIAANQADLGAPSKKVDQPFSSKKPENSTEERQQVSRSKPFEPGKAANALDRAKALCEIANQNFDAMVDQQAQDPKKFVAFCQDLYVRHPGVDFSGKDL